MTIKDILARCNQEGVELSLNDENLNIAFDDDPSEELLNLLRKNKQKIVSYISKKQKSASACRPSLTKPHVPGEHIYSSFPQDMLWFMDELGGGGARFNMNYMLKVKGEFDTSSAERAFRCILERHSPLRTNFKTNSEGKVHPFVNPASDFKIEEVEINENSCEERKEHLEGFISAFTSSNFSLKSDLLLKVAYIKLGEADGVLLITMHHIASDGWSLGVLIDEFKSLYAQKEGDPVNKLEPLEYSYSDYAFWQRNSLTELHEKQLTYWQTSLSDLPSLHSLPIDHPRPLVQEFSGRNYAITLSDGRLQELNKLAAENVCTLFMVFHAAFALLLSKFSYSEDIVIGTLLANRVNKELESLIGFFANTVVLRTQVDGGLSFREFLSQVKQVNLGAQDNQDVPFEKVVERINPNRSQAHTPLCQVMMALDNTPKVEFNLNGVEFFEEEVAEQHTLFDLFLKIYQRGEHISLCFNYSCALFEASNIRQMADAMINLIDNILQNPDAPIRELSCLSALECEQLLVTSEGESIGIGDITQVHHLFEQQVMARPNKVALRFGDIELTYSEVNNRSNQIARRLREQGIKSNSVIALYCERSVEMVIGILGILKSGASYLPLEPSYPDDRLRYMMENSGCSTVLLPESTKLRACFSNVDCCRFSAASDGVTITEKVEMLEDQDKDSLAYVIYTSGSTGLPKGVMISHDSLINRIHWMQANYQLSEQDIVLQKTPFSFDVSVWEFIWPLSYGGCLDVLPPEMHKDPSYLLNFVKQRKISILHFVPSMLRHVLNGYDQEWSMCESIKHVFSSGEALPSDLVTRHFSLHNAKLHNLYGPTEAAIDVSYYECEQGIQSNIPIGKAIQNTQLYILDKYEQALPRGAIGELHISGVGLAKGYINNDELTASKFIYKQIGDGTKRLYKTGDLVRSDANGNIHYLGRLGNQVKIRGFRIELGEIEQSLLRFPEVRSAVVICQKDNIGTPQLIAYVVFGSDVGNLEQTTANLTLSLKDILPNYMIPNAVIPISDIPLTANGKLNTRALPNWNALLETTTRVEPRTETEAVVAGIWSEVLGVSRDVLSIDKSFFSFGGNSLSLIRLKLYIENEYAIDIPAAKLFDTDTIMAQAELVEVFLLSQQRCKVSADVFVEEI